MSIIFSEKFKNILLSCPERLINTIFVSHFGAIGGLFNRRSFFVNLGEYLLVQSDAELVRAVLGGERRAFAELVRRYEAPVRAVGMNILGNRDAADDAAQEAFIKAYEKLGQLRTLAAFGPWLLRIAGHCALDAARRTRKAEQMERFAHIPAPSDDGQLDSAKQELLAAVLKLPKAQRQVVMLRYFGAHSVREVADMCGRSIGTVTKQLSRSHERLRNMLKGYEL